MSQVQASVINLDYIFRKLTLYIDLYVAPSDHNELYGSLYLLSISILQVSRKEV